MPTPKLTPTKEKPDLPPLQLADGRQAALLLLRLFELRAADRNELWIIDFRPMFRDVVRYTTAKP